MNSKEQKKKRKSKQSVFSIFTAVLILLTLTTFSRVQRQDIEEEDDQESYFNYMKNAPVQAYPDDEEVEIDYDSDGNPIVPEKSKVCIKLIINLIKYTFCGLKLFLVSKFSN